MPYADYGFYRAEYQGDLLDEQQFGRLIRRACSYVDNITLGRAASATGDAVSLAACAAAEQFFQEESGGRISSETVGRRQVSYAPEPDSSTARLYRAAALYLEETGLLYPGI